MRVSVVRFGRLWPPAIVVAATVLLVWSGVGVAPAATPGGPALTVSPASGLSDRAQVAVVGSGFAAGATVELIECPAGAPDNSRCGSPPDRPVVADRAGAFHSDAVLDRFFTPFGSAGPVEAVNCAVAGSCVLRAWPEDDPAGPVDTPVTFSGMAGVGISVLPASAPLSLGADGAVTVGGSLYCLTLATVRLTVRLSIAPAGGGQPVAGTGTESGLVCDGTARHWVLTLHGGSGRLPAGSGVLDLTATTASGPVDNAHVERDVTVTAAPATPAGGYYVALGDSLATGFGASPERGYVDLVAGAERAAGHDVGLVALGCSGETTTSMINGPSCSYQEGAQLDAAVAFLRTHRGHVRLVTIDIGGNDVASCGFGPASRPCFARQLATVDANLKRILPALRHAAGPGVRFAAMTYFDPFLINWLAGPDGRAGIPITLDLLRTLNRHLTADFHRIGAVVADVATAFHSYDSTLVRSPWGNVPLNTALACSWLIVTCHAGGTQGFADDANDAGYRVIAAAFERTLGLPVGPTPPLPPRVPTAPRHTSPDQPVTSATAGLPEANPAVAVRAEPHFTG